MGMVLSIAAVLVMRWWPPVTSAFMLEARLEALAGGDSSLHLHHVWVDRDRISPNVQLAVIASEDQKFPFHHGFDFGSIQDAVREQEEGVRSRGASTISQQTARTLFLLPVRSWIRKGLEAYLTVMIEQLWPKKRILEAYLNLVDWGDGIFGAQAAAQAYFGTDAASLDAAEAARLAAILPNPHRWKADHPGRYVRRRTGMLQGRSVMVMRDGLNFCLR